MWYDLSIATSFTPNQILPLLFLYYKSKLHQYYLRFPKRIKKTIFTYGILILPAS